jgi:hypothetical protein
MFRNFNQATPQDNELQWPQRSSNRWSPHLTKSTPRPLHAAKEMLDAKVAGETITNTGEVRKPAP